MMSTRSGRIRQSIIEASPPRTRKGISPTRSPARNRKSSPTVRSSQKSPSRKSPSRKPAPKYPARKSPSRAVKESKQVKEALVPKSPKESTKKAEVVLVDVSSTIDQMRSTRARRLEYSVADFPITLPKLDLPLPDTILNKESNGIEGIDSPQSLNDIYSLRNRRTAEETAPRRSSRLKEIVGDMPDIRRSISKSLSQSVSKSITKSMSKSIAAYSDEEDDNVLQKEISRSQSVTRKLATPLPGSIPYLNNRFEFTGLYGAVTLYVLIPLAVFYILLSCSKACSYKLLKELSLYKDISFWLNAQAAVLVISNFLLQAVFLSIPLFGTREIDEQGRKYYFNAFFSSVCTLSILFVLDYNQILKFNTLLTSYVQMATVSYLIAVCLAVIMYLKSQSVDTNNLNPYGTSGYTLYDFFMGREVQVIIKRINIKLWLARLSNISTLIFSIIIFKHGFHLQEKKIDNLSLDEFKNILNEVHVKPTLLVYSIMQIIYALYFILREKKILATFYWHSEGLGYLQIVCSALYPYYFTTISKYVADTGIEMPTNALIAASILFVLGFLIMLISNNIKYEFRKNPLQPSLIHLDSMPTFHGKKLLVSHLWGILRHPNYTGDIMIHAALALPGIYSKQIIATMPAFITIIMLLHRCWRDHGRCRRRYGAAWHRYCNRVPYVIIPKVL